MARELLLFLILLMAGALAGWMIFGTQEEKAEASAILEKAVSGETSPEAAAPKEPEMPQPKPLEEFLPKELPAGISLVSLNYMKSSDNLHSLTAGYAGGFDIVLLNCSNTTYAELAKSKWENVPKQEGKPIQVMINDHPADQFVDKDLAPKAFAWVDGNFVFTIVRYQPDPNGNLLKLAKALHQ